MRITLILIGKTRAGYLQEGFDEYIARIRRYAPFNLLVIPDVKHSRKTDTKLMCKNEGIQILQKVKPDDYVILLDERGKSFSSETLAKHISGLEGRTGSVFFIVGGAYGFSEEVYSRANEELSLSPLTFSHQMVRLIFAEQLYRVFTILNGEPYHHK